MLQRVLEELGNVRRAVEGLAERMAQLEVRWAAHPPSEDLRALIAQMAVLRVAAEERTRRITTLEDEHRSMQRDLAGLRESRAQSGVTLTGVHKVAGAALGLITLALVALVGYLWRH